MVSLQFRCRSAEPDRQETGMHSNPLELLVSHDLLWSSVTALCLDALRDQAAPSKREFWHWCYRKAIEAPAGCRATTHWSRWKQFVLWGSPCYRNSESNFFFSSGKHLKLVPTGFFLPTRVAREVLPDQLQCKCQNSGTTALSCHVYQKKIAFKLNAYTFSCKHVRSSALTSLFL